MKSSISSSSENQRKTQSVSSIKPIGRLKIELLSFLGVWLLRFISRTLRWEINPCWYENWKALGENPAVIIFWHDTQLLIASPYFLTKRHRGRAPLCALASRHADGRIIARFLERLGFKTVAGSTTRGGAVALHALARAVHEGSDIGITPDGPKGPRHALKDGAVKLAQMTRAPIMVCSYAAKRKWVFKSWDKMFLPKPFSRAYAHTAPLIPVPAALTDQEFKKLVTEIEAALLKVSEECERHVTGA